MWMTLRKRGFIIFSAEERGGGGGRLRLYVFFHHEGDFKDGPGRRTVAAAIVSSQAPELSV